MLHHLADLLGIGGLSVDNEIGAGELAVAFVVLIVTWVFSVLTRRQTLRVERSQTYLSLEIYSGEVFRYEAEHHAVLAPYRTLAPPTNAEAAADAAAAGRALNLYFLTLNLFEVCARFRRQHIIDTSVFASWVAWFYDTLDDWFFRANWAELRTNYTDDVRDIFDLGVALFDRYGDADDAEADARRRADFYRSVAAVMGCREIVAWPDKTRMRALAPPPMPGPVAAWLISHGWRRPPSATRQAVSSPPRLRTTRATSATAKSSAD